MAAPATTAATADFSLCLVGTFAGLHSHAISDSALLLLLYYYYIYFFTFLYIRSHRK